DARFAAWLDQAAELRLQVLVTTVEPQPDGSPRLTERGYRVDAEYVYPASAIKTFLAVAALRTLQRLTKESGVTVDAKARIMRCREDRGGCKPPPADAKGRSEADDAEHERLWVGQEIRKMLSYSDNDSYDRLYDIVGHRELNEQMAALGFGSVRFHHRMNAPASRSKVLRRVTLLGQGGRAVEIPRRVSDFEPQPTAAGGLEIGQAHMGDRGRVDQPMSFAAKNYASLRDMQRLILSLLFPRHPRSLDLGLDDAERAELIEPMTGRLRPLSNAERHKPLLPGVLEVLDEERVRYVGKSGRAYGFHLENAYLEDKRSERGVLVTASVYANPNGVLNDDDYDYEETSKPLLAAIGKAVAQAVFGSR
ncbi:MAG: serine hydrolase, partial [Deltaproteobacteria bacterium]|nr:serine hydrolase [Deltaproteobacteria bacterium]MBW2531161.1 serine hydrolase [Deltaproteobacteria bacterium]